jgi:hypothetical protein
MSSSPADGPTALYGDWPLEKERIAEKITPKLI